jgi:hypothetical protein
MGMSKEGDLVPTDLVLRKVVPGKRVLHIDGDLIPIEKVLRNVKRDLVHIGMLLSNINPATASY